MGNPKHATEKHDVPVRPCDRQDRTEVEQIGREQLKPTTWLKGEEREEWWRSQGLKRETKDHERH